MVTLSQLEVVRRLIPSRKAAVVQFCKSSELLSLFYALIGQNWGQVGPQ